MDDDTSNGNEGVIDDGFKIGEDDSDDVDELRSIMWKTITMKLLSTELIMITNTATSMARL